MPLLQNMAKKNVVVAVFCYNYSEIYIIREKKYTIGGNRNMTDREQQENEIDKGTNCTLRNTLKKIDKNLTICYHTYIDIEHI